MILLKRRGKSEAAGWRQRQGSLSSRTSRATKSLSKTKQSEDPTDILDAGTLF